MASKVILDSPELLGESLVSLTAACGLFPVRCSRPAIERWTRKGSRGTTLETILICGKRYTSKEAIDRFVRNQLQTEPKRPEPRRGNKSKREIDEACQRFGLPKPQATGNE